jgi:hypothetical protein
MEVLGQQLKVSPENIDALFTEFLFDLSCAAGVGSYEFSIRLVQQTPHWAVTFG